MTTEARRQTSTIFSPSISARRRSSGRWNRIFAARSLFSDRGKRRLCVHIAQLGFRRFKEQQRHLSFLMTPRAAADVTFKREKFREEAGGEEAGIAPRAVVSGESMMHSRCDEKKSTSRASVSRRSSGWSATMKQRWRRNQKVRACRDGSFHSGRARGARFGAFSKPRSLRAPDLRILCDDEHARKAFARNGIQRVFDERSSVPCRAEQFIFRRNVRHFRPPKQAPTVFLRTVIIPS